ncbi:MAG: UbiA family prenyltransferase [candidate division WOR-3 bacterium]|nr:UbiA family prenyltransferase [candidate division WOR-3 bacterium]MCX7947712.1 UbiA family prenyltransferase [candidate division WOR-3 bacterium]MDW8150365.1 UbiA family prenyltransferase [candidate division WOR-3 bacterium]
MRFLNILILVALVLFYSTDIDKNSILFIISSIFLILFANFQNDYFDREIDINKGKKRIVLHPSLIFSILLISLITSMFINFVVFLLFVVMAILIYFYNSFSSKKPYGFIITSLVISIGVLSLGFAFGFKFELFLLILFSFFFNLEREIVKSYLDYSYDFGYRRTIAIFLGKQRTIFLAKLIAIFLVLLLVVSSIVVSKKEFIAYSIVSSILIFMYIFAFLNEWLFSKLLKLLMFLGYLSLLI